MRINVVVFIAGCFFISIQDACRMELWWHAEVEGINTKKAV